jgi:CPA1 family monovalent cation:H+ antiporter
MGLFDVAAALLCIAAATAFLNYRFTKLPSAVAMLAGGLVGAAAVLAADALWPQAELHLRVARLLEDVDFSSLLMNGMLGFLLFAGSLTVDVVHLRENLGPVLTLATAGVLISTAIVGGGTWLLFQAGPAPLPFTWCLVFGALISPTDPVAVLAIMETLKVPKALEIHVTAESLLNDGVGVVVFTALLGMATAPGSVSAATVALLLAREAVGGLLLGIAGGVLIYQAMKRVDEPHVEVQLSVAMVIALIALAAHLHVSAPLACVAAGILIGNAARAHAMGNATREALDHVWSFGDYLMNAILFLLLGLQAAVFHIGSLRNAGAVLAVIALVLAARFLSVGLPLSIIRRRRFMPRGMIRVLTWGGLRGGISVALALSLPHFPGRTTILTMTYGVVVFAIVVQGLTVGRVIRRFSEAG